ncbi:MAG: ABC transporter permease [Candidatus Acetothermia bacterium]|nr:ABC transporter permease [Candidatus Acetothermia bacterium]
MFRNFRATLGLTIVTVLALVAGLGPLVAPYEPTRMHPGDRFAPPFGRYLLGTDFYGRDVLSRVLHGYRSSLSIASLSVIFAMAMGSALGITAGYLGASWDTLVMRAMDVLFAFPVLLLAIVIAVILGTGFRSTVLAIGIVYIPIFARVARGPTLVVKEEAFVEAARGLGASHMRIILRHVLPNVTIPIFVQATINLATAILFEASLSFIGLGTQPPNPALGLMVSENRPYIQLSPWPVIFPGLAIGLAVLGFNLLGDGLREVLDPKLRRTQ